MTPLVLLDYDGTITLQECNDVTLQRFTGDGWRRFEDAAPRGEIGHAECFRRQIALLRAPRHEIVAAMVAAAEPAPGFAQFLRDVAGAGGRAVVVSVGVREAIEEVWRRFGLPAVEIHASELRGDPEGSCTIAFDPVFGACPVCGPGGCKGGALRGLREVGEAVAVFGDGLSDLCMAREADVVFAKGTLARLCEAEGIAYHPLGDFRRAWSDLTAWLDAGAGRR